MTNRTLPMAGRGKHVGSDGGATVPTFRVGASNVPTAYPSTAATRWPVASRRCSVYDYGRVLGVASHHLDGAYGMHGTAALCVHVCVVCVCMSVEWLPRCL